MNTMVNCVTVRLQIMVSSTKKMVIYMQGTDIKTFVKEEESKSELEKMVE